MRTIEDHRINPVNDKLVITVLDEPGAGGANHVYRVSGFDDAASGYTTIQFQNGPINEKGVNGLTQEALMAIVIDRLRAFQSGPYACRENALALTNMEQAQHWLLHRTRQRMARGVEGTHKV